jgi:hypothetical protein
VSVATTRAGYIIQFAIGIICIGLWLFLTIYCFTVTKFIGEYNLYYASVNVDNFMVSYAGIGLIPLVIGATLIYNTYQFFIPQKETYSNSSSNGSCPHCGATIDEDATVCQKCKQPNNRDN